MKFKQYLTERRMRSDRMILYHGTSSKFLRPILSKGLQADPKKKVWDIDTNVSSTTSSRASLTGAYMTRNVMTALSSAGRAVDKFGGNRIVLSILFQPRSGVPDEDSVRHYIDGAIQTAMGVADGATFYNEVSLAIFLYKGKLPSFVTCDKDCLVKNFRDALITRAKSGKIEIDPRSFKQKDLENMMQAELTRRVAEYWKTSAKWDKYRGFFEVLEHAPEFQKFDAKERGDKIKEFAKKNVPSPSQAENDYLQNLDLMTRTIFKGMRKDTEDFLYSVRSLSGIGYKGRNKILSIVEILPDEKIGKVRYGTVPQQFVHDYKKSWGDIKIEK